MNTKTIAVWAALAMSMWTGTASATTLNLVQANTNRGTYLTISYNSVERTSFTGALSFSIDGSVSLVDMFCVDLTARAYLNSPYEAVALPPTTLSNGARAAWLFDTFNTSAQSVATGAALQLALWDVVHDGGDGLNLGLLRSTAAIPNDILTQAAVYLNASNGQGSASAVVWESVLGKADRQRMIGQVPEPSTIGLLASGLALLAWKARRKQA